MTVEADNPPEAQAALLAVLDGDGSAYARVVRTYQHRLWALAMMVVQDRAGAEDVAQEAFVRAYAYLERYDRRRPFYPWLATIAVRLGRDWLRRRRREVPLEESGTGSDREAGEAPSPLAELIDGQTARHLWQSVAQLPEGERMAVLLYYRQEMRLAQVAEVLGVSAGSVKTWLFRARKKLRERLTLSMDGTPDR